jgi:DNA-directed RNA polymerase specialized sigma24 family protein
MNPNSARNCGQPHAVLMEMQSYLSRIAGRIHSYYPQIDPQDILQEMNCFILERTQKDPDFIQQQPGYITRAAAWRARDWCRRQNCSRTVGAVELLENVLESDQPDLDLGLALRRALATLPETDRQIARMLAQGYERKEIAQRLGYSSSSALWRALGRIRAALAPAVA